MNDDYKRGYADAMGWKMENHLEQAPMNYYRADAEGNLERTDIHFAQPEQHQDWCASLTQMLMSMPPKPAPCNCKPKPEQEPVACDCDSPAWCNQYKRCNRTMLGLMPYVAQRTWVEIDGDDWIKALEMADFDKVAAFEFFENKLKELNT